MLVFNAPRDLTTTLYKLRARTMHENVHAWSRIRSQRYIIIYHVILCIYSWTLNRSIHCSRIKHAMLQCTTWMFWYIQFITNKHFTTQLSSIVFRTKYNSWREARPSRQLAFVGNIMSTTSGRGRGSRTESRYTQTRPSRLGTSETRLLEPVRISLMSWAEPKYIDIHRFVPTLVPHFFFLAPYVEIPHLTDKYITIVWSSIY